MRAVELEQECRGVSRTIGRAAGIKVVFKGSSAMTNGKVIILPALDHGIEYSQEQVKVARGYTDHEAAHLILTDMARYQEAAAEGGELFAFTLNALEDIRIEKALTGTYPGCAQNLCAVTEAVNGEFLDTYASDPTVTGNAKRILPLAITWEGRKRLGYPTTTNERCLDSVSDEVRKAAARICDALEACHSTEDCITLAQAVCEELDPSGQHQQIRKPGSLRKAGTAAAPSGGGKDKDKGEGAAASGANPAKKDGPGATGAGDDSPLPVGMTAKQLNDLLGKGGGSPAEATPFLDRPYRPFTTEEDEVEGAVPSTDPARSYADMLPQGAVSVIRRKLERALLAKQNRAWLGGHQEGRLDSRRLVSALRGRTHVYKQREEDEEIDTALTLLIDLSGSMNGGRDRGDGTKVKKVECAARTAVALAEAIDKTGVAYSILGFQNRAHTEALRGELQRLHDQGERFSRKTRLRTIVFKGFDEPLVRAQRKLVAIPALAGGDNTDGEHLAIAHALLKKRPERKKVLMVLSDGLPASLSDYGDEHLCGHLQAVVESCERAGTTLVGIGIMSDSAARFYRRHVRVDDPMDLAGATMDQLAHVMLGDREAVLMSAAR